MTVKSGALTIVYADDPNCDGRTYTAGQSFVDRGDENVHTAFNRGDTGSSCGPRTSCRARRVRRSASMRRSRDLLVLSA